MEGRGVTNYSTEKPSFAFSTQTTEFDDALVGRGIVTLEQAFQAKGASIQEANRLASLKRNEQNGDRVEDDVNETNKAKSTERSSGEDADGSFDESDDDDEFLTRYRQQRLEELKKESQGPFGEVVPISRPDWTREVNQDSHKAWVVVTLTSNDVERTGCMEAAVQTLARKFPAVKFVTIPTTAAIENWPDENLPTVFLYRNGRLQRELIRLKSNISADELEWELADGGVLETELDKPPCSGVVKEADSSRSCGYGGLSTFGGSMAELKTRRSERDDYDDVD